MKATDLRDATFASLRNNLSELNRVVYAAWVTHGANTTRALAEKSGIDILNVRPRTTDLCEIGLVELVGDVRGREGIYQAASEAKWMDWHRNHLAGQMQLL